MASWLEIIALTIGVAIFPVAAHMGVLNGSALRPPVEMQASKIERAVFRHLPRLFLVNGGFAAAVFILTVNGSHAAAFVVGLVALPTVVTQGAALVIARFRDVAETGGKSAKTR